MNADAIAVIKDGRVVEFGPHGELLSKRGEYYHLVAEQKTSADSNDSYPRQNNNRRMSAIDASALNDVNGEALVRFREVHFRYPTRMSVEVFRGLNLSVRRGETLGLVGSSGCGKSTIVQLIERFYDPTEGVIEYNSIDLKDLNVSWLREQLGLVGQEATLFPGTIEENIRYGLADATTTEVVEAAKDANCHEFITAFPDGYATRIGEGGSLISGGQKQRIAIARAIIKKPKLLLLDESTSALDSEAEKIVQAALDNIMAKKGQTCIVIAHRYVSYFLEPIAYLSTNGFLTTVSPPFATLIVLQSLTMAKFARVGLMMSSWRSPTDSIAASMTCKASRPVPMLRSEQRLLIKSLWELERRTKQLLSLTRLPS